VDLGYVEPDPVDLVAMTNQQRIAQATQRNRENKAKFWIQNSVDDSIFSKIIGAGTSKQAWDILKSSYQGNDRVKTVKLQTLRTQFETLRMTESENVDQFMTRVMGIVNQIRLTGEAITDQHIVEKFLRSLPRKFEMVVTTILQSKDLSCFSTDELTSSLVTYETRLHLTDELIANAFKTQLSFSRGRGRGRGRGHQGRGSTTSDQHSNGGNRQQSQHQNFQGHKQQHQNQNFQPQRGRERRSNGKSSIQCYYCKKCGHYESKCKKKQADHLSIKAHVSNHMGETSKGMFLSCHKSEEQPKDIWLLDSGCNNHMTGNKYLLSCIDSSISSNITLGNDSLVKFQGKGIVPILTKQNENKDINNVYHVPDLKHNLLSVG
jgi:transposase InsO family protein